MTALVAAASVVVFPVDDLYGKVDVPLVLIEAMALGVPVIVCRDGPPEMVESARAVEPSDDDALAARPRAPPPSGARPHITGNSAQPWSPRPTTSSTRMC